MKYEESIKKVETILSDIESGNMDIDSLASGIKEAKKYIKNCQDILTKVEGSVSEQLEN